ncbi:shiftless antiviral inhibitor of ribosomal frameshifting protein homolog isoform X2 [Stegostoma tigrinum]|uniref:shiftless antiviral inhibitor of ribosomal frameshifting protein homolog isoform X2 n=1 Tax=Stegostoma tigrinum TaxID=3053191 RepID=UPI00202B6697|nr:shiftless antiviral inhibitor of ribosomal frameshifting protein homolog isoform X2 [Stegostoma tigrinum]
MSAIAFFQKPSMAHMHLKEKIELEKSVRRFREMFHGNVPLELAVLLMNRFRCNYQLVAKHIILMVPDLDTDGLEADDRREIEASPVLQDVIETLQAEERKAKEKTMKIKEDPEVKKLVSQLTQANLKLFDQASAKQIPWVEKQFACRQCDHYWWRRVPDRKQVSRCRKCKVKYGPVPRDKMWGYAEFHCQCCGNTFGGFGQMALPAPCYVCHSCVTPVRILPPKKGVGPRTRRPHSCFAEDCYHRKEPHIPGTHCVHPRSRQQKGLPRVLYPSPEHHSTGSTIATCLSQGSLMECHVDNIIEEDILEEEEEEDTTEEDDEDSTEHQSGNENSANGD